VFGCADSLVADQRLFVVLPSSERRIIRTWRTALRKALKSGARQSIGNIQPCPDHRQKYGDIVQVADMIAGEVHEQAGLGGPNLATMSSRIRLV
jgi:hypothetical protein